MPDLCNRVETLADEKQKRGNYFALSFVVENVGMFRVVMYVASHYMSASTPKLIVWQLLDHIALGVVKIIPDSRAHDGPVLNIKSKTAPEAKWTRLLLL